MTNIHGEIFRSTKQEKQLIDYFGEENMRFNWDSICEHPPFILLFSNRSGSNLLAERLRSTGKFFGFGEKLLPNGVISICQKHQLKSFEDYLIHLISLDRIDGAFFGIKAAPFQLAMLLKYGNRKRNPIRLININRRDIIAQAVSFSIADQSKQWTSSVAPSDVGAEFDFADIDTRVQGLLNRRGVSDYLASLFELPMVDCWYEDLVADPYSVIDDICRFHNIDVGDWFPTETVLSKQSTELNRRFIERYRLEALRALP